MLDRESLIAELEDAISRGPSHRHTEALQRITDLFLIRADELNEGHVELFDDVLLRLAGEIETRARAELARRLAPVANAPLNTVRKLARDEEIAVAAPVLLRSERLAESDLLDIARSNSQSHLLAISNRRRIGEAVTDVLVNRGDSDVLLNVASNPGASLSADGLSALVAHAEQDESLAERVGARADIPAAVFHKLVMQASELVRRRLVAAASPELRDEVQQVLATVSREIDPEAPSRRNFTAAQRLMRMLHESGALGEDELRELARAKRYEEAVAAIVQLCSVSLELVDGLMSGDRLEPLLVLLKAAGHEWLTVRAVILMRPAGRRLSARELADICDDYNRLSFATARRVMAHWQHTSTDLRAAG